MSTGHVKTRVGRVVSNKMQKTVVVAVEWRKTHRVYKKSFRRITRFKAHDEESRCRIGDIVRIVETRPLSKDKRWRVTEVMQQGAAQPAPVETEAPQ